MELTIKLTSGRNSGKQIPIATSKFLIGRADDCHLRPHSDLVSRHHCVLLIEEGFCAIRDFGSRNGTYVNDEKIVGQRELHNGDNIKVGVLEFEIELSSSVGGKKRPKVKDVKDVAQRTAASNIGGDQDEDISDWLSDEKEPDIHETRQIDPPEIRQPPHETPSAAAQPTRDTVFLKKSPTEETTTAQPIKPQEPAKAPEQPAAESGRGAETAKRLFGKPAPGAQKGPVNSRDAAADALKKFFNTRKP